MNELTDVCEGSEGSVFPSPPPDTPGCDTSFHYEIVALLTANGTPSVQGLNTTSRSINCTLITIVILVSGSREEQAWQLRAGQGDPDAGDIMPSDYNATTNDKHWEKVG